MRWILHLSKSSRHIFHCILLDNSLWRDHFWITWMKLTVPVKAWKKPFQQLSGSLESLCMLIEHALTSFKGVRNEEKCLQELCLLHEFFFLFFLFRSAQSQHLLLSFLHRGLEMCLNSSTVCFHSKSFPKEQFLVTYQLYLHCSGFRMTSHLFFSFS